jgi:2'-5' RNA ligase
VIFRPLTEARTHHVKSTQPARIRSVEFGPDAHYVRREMSQSALIVKIPEAEPLVGALRDRFDPVARLGVPAHVTILYPFMAPEFITGTVLHSLGMIASATRAFDCQFRATGRFPDALYLAPTPARDFIALTIRVAEAFPECPPYGGKFGTIAPHLTVARGAETQLHGLEQALNAEPRLQAGVCARCATLALIENSAGRWRDMHAFALSP